MNTDYEKQANDFLLATDTTMKVVFLKFGLHFADDKDKRDIYEIIFTRGNREFSVKFGQSIVNSGFKFINHNTKKEFRYTWQDEAISQSDGDIKKFRKRAIEEFNSLGNLDIVAGIKPTAYDVLTSLTKNEVGTFENFCGDFGYDTDSRKAETTYKATLNEYNNVKMLWSDDEITQLQEIQ